jgi:hypothetical protein
VVGQGGVQEIVVAPVTQDELGSLRKSAAALQIALEQLRD